MESNKSAVLASSLTGIICDVRIRRSAGEHRTRLTSANRQRRRHWPPDAMARRCQTTGTVASFGVWYLLKSRLLRLSVILAMGFLLLVSLVISARLAVHS